MLGRLACCIGLMLLAGAGQAEAGQQLANIFYEDDRQAEARSLDSDFAAVGALQILDDGRWRGRGAATLVSPCHVLTAHHIAFGGGRAPGDPLSFAYGPPRDGRAFAERVRAFAVIWGNRDRHVHEDWALLRLEPCIGEKVAWWPPVSMTTEEAAALPDGVMLAGLPGDRNIDAVSVDPSCRVVGSDLRLPPAWLHDCATRIGDSGGALFRIGENGKPVLLGVVHAEGTRRSEILSVWTPAHSNFAVPVANFIDRIHPYLAGAQ